MRISEEPIRIETISLGDREHSIFDGKRIKHYEIEIVREMKKWLPQYIQKCDNITFIAQPFINHLPSIIVENLRLI